MLTAEPFGPAEGGAVLAGLTTGQRSSVTTRERKLDLQRVNPNFSRDLAGVGRDAARHCELGLPGEKGIWELGKVLSGTSHLLQRLAAKNSDMPPAFATHLAASSSMLAPLTTLQGSTALCPQGRSLGTWASFLLWSTRQCLPSQQSLYYPNV